MYTLCQVKSSEEKIMPGLGNDDFSLTTRDIVPDEVDRQLPSLDGRIWSSDHVNQKPRTRANSSQRLHHMLEYLRKGAFSEQLGWNEKRELKKLSAKFQLLNDSLYFLMDKTKEKRLVLLSEEERQRAMWDHHVIPESGAHRPIVSTAKGVLAEYYWMEVTKDVTEFIKNCPHCNSALEEEETYSVDGVAGIELAQGTWVCVYVQVAGPFPVSRQGNSFVLLLMDLYSHWMELLPMASDDAQTVSCSLLHSFNICGYPEYILLEESGDTSALTRSLGPRLNGSRVIIDNLIPNNEELVSQINGVRISLEKLIADCAEGWDVWISMLIWPYNSAFASDKTSSPYNLMYGNNQHSPIAVDFKGKIEIRKGVCDRDIGCTIAVITGENDAGVLGVLGVDADDVEIISSRNSDIRLQQIMHFLTTKKLPETLNKTIRFALKRCAKKFKMKGKKSYSRLN